MSLLRWLSVCTLVFSVANVSFADTKDTVFAEKIKISPNFVDESWRGLEHLRDFLIQKKVTINGCHSKIVLSLLELQQSNSSSVVYTTNEKGEVYEVEHAYDRIGAKGHVFKVKAFQKWNDALGLTCDVHSVFMSLSNLNVETVVRSELIPQTWSYECSDKHDEYYGSPCVLKNESNRTVFAHLSKSIHVMQGTLPEFLRYKKGDIDGICRLLYVQPKPFMYDGPKGYIVDSDWITARSLGKVDSTYCLAPK